MKYVVFLGDGMADTPVKELGNKTPLEVAKKPNIDFLASKGVTGMIKTVPDGMKPGSDVANLGAMGFNPEECYTGRSPLEAVSVGIKLEDTDITFRVNLVTLSDEEVYEEKTMIDYSSDEITTEEARILINDLAKELTYMGRTGSHQENANIICFLASDEATFVTGQNIQVDGCRRKI